MKQGAWNFGRQYFPKMTEKIFLVLYALPEPCHSPIQRSLFPLVLNPYGSWWLSQCIDCGWSDALWLLRVDRKGDRASPGSLSWASDFKTLGGSPGYTKRHSRYQPHKGTSWQLTSTNCQTHEWTSLLIIPVASLWITPVFEFSSWS